MYETLADAKAASHEDGDVVTTGFYAPPTSPPADPRSGTTIRTAMASCGRRTTFAGAVFGNPIFWDAAPPRIASGWSLSWFRRFPTPPQAAAASPPGLRNGDATDGLNGDAFRFVDESGAGHEVVA